MDPGEGQTRGSRRRQCEDAQKRHRPLMVASLLMGGSYMYDGSVFSWEKTPRGNYIPQRKKKEEVIETIWTVFVGGKDFSDARQHERGLQHEGLQSLISNQKTAQHHPRSRWGGLRSSDDIGRSGRCGMRAGDPAFPVLVVDLRANLPSLAGASPSRRIIACCQDPIACHLGV